MKDERFTSAGTLMRREQIAIIALAGWLTVIAVSLILTQKVDLSIFFVLALIGLLIIVELISPKYIQPRYMRSIKYLLAAAIVVFGLIVVQKILEILGFKIVFA
jgi:hypothetical protein